MSEVFSIFLGCVIFSITDILFVRIFTKNEIKRSNLVLCVTIFIMSIFHTIMVLEGKGILKTILNLLFYVFAYKYLFKINWKKSIFFTFLYIILLLLPDLIIMIFAISVFKVDINYFYNEFVGSFYATILISIIMLLITYILRIFLNKISTIELEKNRKIIIISGLVLLSLAIMFYKSFSFITYNLETILILIIIIIFIIVLFTLIKERVNNDNLKEQYDKLLEFMVTYEKEVEEQRILRHENKNNLIAIKSKIIDKDNEKEIVNYIDELLNISTKIKNEKYAKFGYLPSNGLKGLFYYKTDEAENKGIKVSINISKDIKKISNI